MLNLNANVSTGGAPVVAQFQFDVGGIVRLGVFNSAGEQIRVLAEGRLPPKTLYEATWDLTNYEGKPVGTGVYVFRIELEGKPVQTIRKVAVLR